MHEIDKMTKIQMNQHIFAYLTNRFHEQKKTEYAIRHVDFIQKIDQSNKTCKL